MARYFPELLSPEAAGALACALAVCAAMFFFVRARRKKRPTPEQLEARRREWLSKYGKLGGGEVLEIQEFLISYLYEVRGMTYSTSQDVSALEAQLPEDLWSIVGGVGVRYDPRNPANSIILSESWTGLRHPSRTRS